MEWHITALYLFALYYIILMYVIYRLPFFRYTQINFVVLAAFFTLKVFCALLYGYFHAQYYGGGDTWEFLKNANTIFETLHNGNLRLFFRMWLGTNGVVTQDTEILNLIDRIGVWRDSSNYFMLRLNIAYRLLSGGYYEIHALFAAFVSFLGVIYWWHLLKEHLEIDEYKRYIWIVLGIACVPSVIFWTSGLHKDGVCFLLLSAMNFYALQYLKKRTLRTWLLFFVCVALLYVLRVYLLVAWLLAFLPCVLTRFRFFASYQKQSRWIMVLLPVLIWFLLPYLPFSDIILQKIINTQAIFVEAYAAHTDIYLLRLSSDYHNWWAVNINALYNVWLLPFFQSRWSVFMIFTQLENVVLFIAVLYCFYKSSSHWTIFRAFLLLFALLSFCIIGMMVDNVGALVRYRSTSLFFLLFAAFYQSKNCCDDVKKPYKLDKTSNFEAKI